MLGSRVERGGPVVQRICFSRWNSEAVEKVTSGARLCEPQHVGAGTRVRTLIVFSAPGGALLLLRAKPELAAVIVNQRTPRRQQFTAQQALHVFTLATRLGQTPVLQIHHAQVNVGPL